MEAKKPKISQPNEKPEPPVENDENVVNEPTITKEIPEPEVYDFEDIQRRINSVRISEINKVLSPGEIKIVEALEVIQNKKDTKLVEYVRSVEESLNNGVIDNDYVKQAIINYLEENL